MKVFVKEEIRMVEFDVGCIAALTAALERSFGKFQVFIHPSVVCFSKANDQTTLSTLQSVTSLVLGVNLI